MSEAATRSDWQILPLPAARARLIWSRIFTAHEASTLRQGLIPRSMDDRWFVFVEADLLYFHRSWTGEGIFAVRMESAGETTRAAEAWVTMEDSYRPSSWDERINMLDSLIDMMLSDTPYASQGFSITQPDGATTEFYSDGRR